MFPAAASEHYQSPGTRGILHGRVPVKGGPRESKGVGFEGRPLQGVQRKHVDLMGVSSCRVVW